MNKTSILLTVVVATGCASGLERTFYLSPGHSDSPVAVEDLRVESHIPLESSSWSMTSTASKFYPTLPIADYVSGNLKSSKLGQSVQIQSFSVRANGSSLSCNLISSISNGSSPYARTEMSVDSDVLFGDEVADMIIVPCLDKHISDIQISL